MKTLLPLLCLAAVPLTALAIRPDLDSRFEAGSQWVEMQIALPPAPRDENLVPFSVSSATRHRFYVDAASVSVGEDLVVRYTVVIDSAGGARNVNYEGLRCETGERRLYAYARPDGSWTRAQNSQWEGIRFRSLLSYQKALFEDHFCPGGIRVKDGKEAVRNLRQASR